MSSSPPDPSRLSLNQKTTNNWSVWEAAEGCARAGIGSIGLWRDKVSETGLSESARLVQDAGLRVGFHANDWLSPKSDLLLSRAMMGDGPIQIRRIREAVDAAGYSGPIEVEIFNQDIWDTPGDQTLATIRERYLAYI